MKSRFIKYSLILLLFISFCLIFIKRFDIVKADSGWDTDYDSGGSWDSSSDYDSGGSWDSSSDYDSSWDSDYDNDSYNYSSSNSSSSGSSACGEQCEKILTIISLIVTGFIVLLYALGIIIVVVKVILGIIKGIIRIFIRPNKKNDKQVKNKINYKQMDEEKASSVISDFNIEEFNFKAYQIFYDVQISWMNFDYDKLKELVTDELYNSYVMQLDALKIKEQKNVMKDFELIECFVFDLKEENGLYIARVYLNVKFYDYIQNTKNEMVVRGNSYKKYNNIYILTFISSKEKATNVNKCPMCGAEVMGNATGVCSYCNTKLINENYNWIMSKKEKIDQK